jgi:PAS domain S-box-containing protein/putative nucleotidyltransferase with HDIG domain
MAERHGGGPEPTPGPLLEGNQAVLVISTDRRVLWSNEAARRLLSRTDEPLAGLLCHSLLSGRDGPCQADDGCPLTSALDSGRPAACTLHRRADQPALQAALHPVPGPHGEVAEFVVTISPPRTSQGPDARACSEELALLFTLSEMDKRGCSVNEVLELLARRLCRSLDRQFVSIYLPSRDARHLLMLAGTAAPGIRQPLERALGGTLPRTVAIPERSDSVLWRAFRASRHTLLRSEEDIRRGLLEHAQSPALRQVLPGLQAALSVGAVRLIPVRTQGQPVGLVLLAGHTDLSKDARERARRSLEDAGELVQRMVLRDERRRLQRRTAAILSAVQDGVLGLDTSGRVNFANATAIELLGWNRDNLGGRTLQELHALPPLPPGVDAQPSDPILRATLSGTRVHQVETELHHRDGRVLQVSASVAPLEEDGEVHGAVVTFSDISERKRVEAELRRSLEQLRLSLSGTVLALGRMAEMRDPYTAGHQQRVAQLAQAIAERMGLPRETTELVRLAALVHDIGKIGIPVELLTKPGQLASHEFELIRTHTTVGWEILEQAHLHQAVADIARQHHERLDGSGYPDGLEGTRIRREARIIAVADTVEAMASHRPYRPARGIDEALAEIFRQRGRHYEPAAVDACIQLFRVAGFTFLEESR